MDDTKNPVLDSGTFKFKVNKDVVAHLSVGLYRNFGRAIKELVSNSYDACATEVKIKVDIKNKQVIIRDNGNGMNKKEIEDHFLHIARRTKVSEDKNELGRERIGTFGIGFLGTFPYCKEYELITKKKDGNEIIRVVIDTQQFFE
jgi:HSP90 family molecular chaperone